MAQSKAKTQEPEEKEKPRMYEETSCPIKTPTELQWLGNMAENWRFFKQKFQIYLTASKNMKADSEYKVALLLNAIGDRGVRLYNTLVIPTEKKNDYETVIKAFEEHFDPEKNVTYERYKFLKRNQKSGESYEDYIMELRDLSSTCEFGNLTDGLIRDRLVCGVIDTSVTDRLLRMKDLTLAKASEVCRASQEAKKQLEDMCSSNASSSNLEEKNIEKIRHVPPPDATKSFMYRRERAHQPPTGSGNKNTPNRAVKRQCDRCGYQHAYNSCPAFNKKCNFCGKSGHFAALCRARTVRCVHRSDTNSDELSDDSETHSLGLILMNNINSEWKVTVGVNNVPLELKVDTGAQANVIHADDLAKLDLDCNNLIPSKAKLTTYTGEEIKHLGRCTLPYDPLPPYNGKLRVYNMRYCPYAQRTILALNAKQIDYEVVNIDLVDKPQWLTSKSAFAKVPSLEIQENVCIYESLITVEYLDEVYPQRPLLPKDPVKKAFDKITIEACAPIHALYFKTMKSPETITEATLAAYSKALDFLEAQLKSRGTKFLDGAEPGYADYMIWPWFERSSAYKEFDERTNIDGQKYTLLVEWMKNMFDDPAVSQYLIPKDVLINFMSAYKKGEKPDYNIMTEN